jgi:CDP-4-dehydro-6-deoxyglucose reductase
VSGRVTFVDHGVTIEARPGETILGAVCRSGYVYRYGCRRGGCGVCKAIVVGGTVTYAAAVADTVLTAADGDRGLCLTCRAVPNGDIQLRLVDGDELRCVSPLLAGALNRALTKEIL